MTLEDATQVAISCIQAASRMKTKDIRLQDTLAFVGINDELRVDALKRHIVRNPNIGVSRVEDPKLKLKYLILNDHLSGIETKWTVAKLAQTIAEKAGVARLTHSRAALIVAACRENTAKFSSTIVIRDDTGKPEAFAKCLGDREKGVGSAGVSDPTGRDYRYAIDPNGLIKGINDGWTYAQLIEHIAETASIPNLPSKYGG